MKNSTLLILIGVGIALVVISTLAVKSCNEPKPEISATQRAVDSIAKLEKETAHVVDSVLKEKNHLAAEKDSLRRVTESQSLQLELKSITIKSLARQYEIYKKFHDQDNQIVVCDSLIPQIDSLTESLAQYRHSNKALENKIMSIEDANSLANASKDYYLGALKESFDKVSATALSLEKTNKTLDKKASRRWSVGPVAAYGVDRRVKPDLFVGVGISFSILKF